MANQSTLQTDDHLLEQMKAYRVEGSPLNQHAQSIAEQFGISGDVEVFVSRSKLINAQMRDTTHGKRIVITEPMLHALDSSAHGHVSDELKAVIGHELGHVAEGGLKPYLLGGLLPIYALPVIAVVARHYIMRAHEKQLPPYEARNYIYTQADAEHAPLPYQTDVSSPQAHTHEEKAIVSLGKDVAVGALGLGAGSFLARFNSNQLEHRCDRWGARASSPEAMIRSFQKMEDAYANMKLSNIKVPFEDPFAYGEVKSKVGKVFIDFLRETVASHPDTASRIKYLEKLAANTAAHAL